MKQEEEILKEDQRKGWCIFHDWIDVLKRLNKSDAWDVIMAINQYYLTGKDPVEMVCNIEQQVIVAMMYQQIQRQQEVSAKRKKAGQIGGENKAKDSKAKQSVAKDSKAKQSVAKDSKAKQSVATYTDTITNTITNTITEPSVMRGQYGNVVLSESDLDKLRQEFPNDYLDRIERLSEYMASSGTQYKNHLATIRSWARKDKVRNNTQDQDTTFDTDSFWDAAVKQFESQAATIPDEC
jgi:hypothetical protein